MLLRATTSPGIIVDVNQEQNKRQNGSKKRGKETVAAHL